MKQASEVQKKDTIEKVVIIGAGPAGLTAAYELSKAGLPSTVVEKDSIVGGLARTVNYNGYRFDIGGHRFFTKVSAVENMWEEVLGEDFLTCKRLSRIYFNKSFFYYPFRLPDAVLRLGIWNSFLVVVSYMKSQFLPKLPEDTFDKWVSNRFGTRLYELFFKTYTEKVWGIPCSEISAEWAAQRIKGLSLMQALRNTLLKGQNSDKEAVIKTLIDSFQYPRLGPGMMWETVADSVTGNGSELLLNSDVRKIHINNGKVDRIEIAQNGEKKVLTGSHFISSMPVRELVEKIEPPVAEEVRLAARNLKYRDFLTVSLIIDETDLFPDNWIYIHDPDVKLGRVQNFKNWSKEMVPEKGKTCLGLEYFCFEGDGLWNMSDSNLIELGKKELEKIGLADVSLVTDGTVVRMPKAYPVYDSHYKDSLTTIRSYLEGVSNLQLVGRNGMHKYNNQDHSMLTAMLAVKNILGESYDLWQVNAEQEYHEEVKAEEKASIREIESLSSTQPKVPEPIVQNASSEADQVLVSAFASLDKFAFAVSVGIVSAIVVFIATIFLIIKGGPNVGANLGLLSQYFVGYSVSIKGALIGFAYTFFWGLIFGWLFAYLRNVSTGFFIFKIKKERELSSFRNFIDYI